MSDNVKKRIGLGTAYGEAKSKGYTGTQEEFAELMYNITIVGERAEAAKDAAQAAQSAAETAEGNAETAATQAAGSATTASGAASTATQKAGEASTSANNAAASASQSQTYASNAEQSATSASGSASAASGSATAAAGSASAASQSETNAAASATAAEQSAAAAAESARTLTLDTTLTQAGQAAEAKATGDAVAELKSQIETKAEIDGYYQDMTVGDAEQMISTQYVEDTEPYLYRTTGGTTDVGNREYLRAITGGTVVWNQQLNKHTRVSNEIAGLTVTVNNDGYVCINGTATENNSFNVLPSPSIPANHVVLIICDGFKSNLYWGRIGFMRRYQPFYFNKHNRDFSGSVSISFTAGKSYDLCVRFSTYDLTQMFGSTIADYIYQLEQTTEGAGVAFFRKLFPAEYYPYDAGSLKSVEGLQSHEMVGFNQWDGVLASGYYDPDDGTVKASTTWSRSANLIPCFPETDYCFTKNTRPSGGSAGYILFYGADGTYLHAYKQITSNASDGGMTFTTPQNCRYMAFYSATIWMSEPDICINLSWSGTRNGEYEPYVKHTYALDDSLTLRGIPKLSDDGKLMYDGDRYLPDGTVERRYGVVDLGTLNWTMGNRNNDDTGYVFRSINLSNVKGAGYAISPYFTFNQSKYNNAWEMLALNEMIINNSGTILCVANYTDAAFKTAMSGVMLVYELATPTTETADPYPEVQLCDDWGTERFVTDSIVPVGTETDYPANLRDKLQHLPDLASADGYYAIKQVGTQMTLEPFRIPKAPTTDGTYTLRATVSGGVPTYTWEQEVIVNASEEA